MKSVHKRFITGIVLLAISGINVYLPAVGNLFDTWRIGVALIAFTVGTILTITAILDYID